MAEKDRCRPFGSSLLEYPSNGPYLTRRSRNQTGSKFRKLEPLANCVQRPMDIDREAHPKKISCQKQQRSVYRGTKGKIRERFRPATKAAENVPGGGHIHSSPTDQRRDGAGLVFSQRLQMSFPRSRFVPLSVQSRSNAIPTAVRGAPAPSPRP
jgi:hypothetical protein